jgi:hypothetical protein
MYGDKVKVNTGCDPFGVVAALGHSFSTCFDPSGVIPSFVGFPDLTE